MADFDVAILGGGLAGLTLGLQLKRKRPQTSIFIAERRVGPAREAAFKVGESSVEVSARYFIEACGMGDHLAERELTKCGLRFFFPAGDNSDITQRVEWGMIAMPPVHTYQIDRGRFENELATRNLAIGNDLRDGCTVLGPVQLDPDSEHRVTISRGGEESTISARWVVDATGPVQLLKKQLGINREVEHTINATWFRLKGGLDLEQWGAHDTEWMDRMEAPGIRQFSTNHLMGEGYWVWLIPLASGPISIGIVSDPRFHDRAELIDLESTIDWLNRHEPLLGADVEARLDAVEDFHHIPDFAYASERVFSPDRWAMSGVSGVFLDPFYSPGSDFIGYGNSMITKLVEADLDGEDITGPTEAMNGIFMFQFERALEAIYTNNYQFWGNAEVMTAKVAFDHMMYWSILALPFYNGKTGDLDFAGRVIPHVQRMGLTRLRIQQLLRDWHALGQREWRNAIISNSACPGIWERLLDLHREFTDEELEERYSANADIVQAIAVVIFHRAATRLPDNPLPEDARINPMAISLDPDKWEEDGLFNGEGFTLAEAIAAVPGVEHILLDDSALAPA